MSQNLTYLYKKDEIFPPLPFEVKLSLNRVFEFWEHKAAQGSKAEQIQARSVLDSVAHAPILREPIADLDLIEQYSDEIRILLSAMFPDILATNEIKAASLPFKPILFNTTQRFRDILDRAGDRFQMALRGFEHKDIYMMACAFIIGVVYKQQVNFKRPIYYDIPDQETGQTRHYRVMINGDFSMVRRKPDAPELTPADIQQLIDHSYDIDLWHEKIPPGSYEFEGLALLSLYDQTEDEALSELRNLLLKGNALQDEDTLMQLQVQLSQYLSVDAIDLGFEAFDESAGTIKAVHGSVRPSKLLGDAFELKMNECFCDESADLLLRQKDYFAISNVKEMAWAPSPFIQRMFEKNVGSFIVAPLKYNERVIALIELTSPDTGMLNSMVANKLKFVLPMFTVAVGRSIENHQTELEAIIQDKFTTIHPTVAWKFFRSAEKVFQHRNHRQPEEIDPINFKDVFPLYGQFDIRGSSDARNASIQSDLKEQLDMATDVLRHAADEFRFPVYQQLIFRVQEYRHNLDNAIHAGDEVKILDFIARELDPVFSFIETQPALASLVEKYKSALDPELRVVYKQRKDYERSVTIINERISDYVDQQQAFAQTMFPHYFEKYKTDGVEYNAYIGQSLVQSDTYHPLHLKNLRLWQLLITCGVEHLHQSYKGDLPQQLDITSLILVHSNPLAIRFRMDEKRFDVDGAYNIRYEILKKRIDKAYIKGTSDRLTQPCKLAIVYSQDWEAEEYLQYIRYLQSIDYLDDNLERLELQDLQGTAGLQALRVGFKYEVSPDALIEEMMREVAS